MESCRAVCTMTVTQQATLRDPVALPGPDTDPPYAGSTEPFDGTERSHLTRHLEFKCFETVCFQKVTSAPRTI